MFLFNTCHNDQTTKNDIGWTAFPEDQCFQVFKSYGSGHSKGSDLLKVSWSSCCVFKLIVKSKQCQACGLEVVRARPLLVAKDPIFHSPSLTGGNKSHYL